MTTPLNKPNEYKIELLSSEEAQWYGAEAIITVSPWPCWFPSDAICDVFNGKYVAKKQFKKVKIGGNLGSACAGIMKGDENIAVKMLEAFGLKAA